MTLYLNIITAWTIPVHNVRLLYYSVMQSDGNSFGGDVVLDRVNMVSSYEDRILDQIYE